MKYRYNARLALPLAAALTALLAGHSANAASQTWGANGNSAWYTAGNWAGNAVPGLQGVAASNTDIATFTNAFTGTTVGINMGTNSLNLGAISIDATRTTATNIGNSSATAGVLRLYGATVNGVSNVILRNAGSGLITLQASQAGTMGVVLSNTTNNIISIEGTGGVTVSSILSSAAASTLTLQGSGTGVLTLTGANTFTGTTVINSGTLNLGGGTANGSLAAATLTLAGGTLSYTRTGSTTQSFTTTNINAGGTSGVSAVSGNILNLGTVARGVGGYLDFGSVGAGTVAALAANNDSTGIMAGLTFGNTWAVANGAGVAVNGLANGSYTLSSAAGNSAANYAGLNIDVNSSQSLDAVITANSLRFTTSAANTLTLTGTTNTITSGGILVGSGVGANLTTISGGTLRGASGKDLSIIQNNTSGGLTISSIIGNNGGATALTKSGAGLLTLEGNNTFTGGVFINGGKVILANAGALNSTTANNVTLRGTLTLNGNNLTIPVLSGNDGVSGVIENASSSNVTLTINSGSNSNFGGVIQNGTGTGTLALTKSGSGTLTLAGANTYTGGTTLSAGTLVANNGSAFGTGKVTVSGSSTLNFGPGLTFTNDIAVNAAVTMKDIMNTQNILTFSGVLSGSSNITISNNGNNGVVGEFAFTNTANTWTGNVVLVSGSSPGDDRFSFNSIGDGGNFTFQKSGHQNSIIYTGSSNLAFTTRTINVGAIGGIYDGGGTIPVNAFTNNGTGTVTFNANMTVGAVGAGGGTLFFNGTNAGNNTYAGTIGAGTGGAFGIGKTGTGKWILTGSNSYTGEVLIRNGTLSVNAINTITNNQPLGKNAVVQLGHNGDSGILEFTGAASSTDKTFRLGSTQAAGLGTGTILNNGSGALTYSATTFNPTITGITATRLLTLGGSYTGGTNEIQGIIQDNVASTGKVGVTKTGAGTWKLSGANTYTGNTIINAGTLDLGNVKSLGNSGTLDFDAASTTRLSTDTAFGGSNPVYNVRIDAPGSYASTIELNRATAGAVTGITHNFGAMTITLNGGGAATVNVTAGANAPTGGALDTIAFTSLSAGNNNAVTETFNPTGGNITFGTVQSSTGNASITTIALSGTTAGNAITGVIGGINANQNSVAITKTNSSTWTLSANSSYTGATTIQAGTLVAGANAAASGTGAFGNSSAGALILGNASTLVGDAPTLLINGSFTVGRDVTVGTSASTAYNATIGGSNTSGTSTFSGGITLINTGTYTTTLRASTGGTVDFTGTWTNVGNKAIAVGTSGNTGTVKLSSAIATTGGINVNYGTLNLAAAFTDGNMILASGTTLSGTGSVAGTTGATGATINGSGLTLAGATTFNSTGNVLSGTVTSTSGVSLASSASLAVDGALTGSLSIGNGNLTGTGGSVSGAVTLNGGTVNLNSGTLDSTLDVTGGNWNGAGSVTGLVTSSSGTFTVGNSANLTANGNLDVTGGSIVAGNTISTITGSVNYTSSTSSTFQGVIAGAGKTLTMNNSSSTLTLSGTNTYTGATIVSAGTLNISSSGSTASGSSVTVDGTSSLVINGAVNGSLFTTANTTLSGTGTVVGDAEIQGTHNPGNSPGIQGFGNLTYSGGASVVNWELIDNVTTNAANPNAKFDQIVVGGNLNFAGVTTVNLLFNGIGSDVLWNDALWGSDQSWLLYDVSGSITNFGNLTLNSIDWLDSESNPFDAVRPEGSFSFSQGAGGIYLNYAVVPETSTSLLGALGALALLRRRRK